MGAAKVIGSPVEETTGRGAERRGEVTEVRRRDRAVGVPRVLIPPARVRELPIDPRVAFVLSRIDGESSFETLLDVTGFEAEELLSVLARLVRLRAVAM